MYTSKQQYLAILRKVGEALGPLDTKAKRKEFYATDHLVYNDYMQLGLTCWIEFKRSEARGERGSLEQEIRDCLAWGLARLKYDGIVPKPHVMKLACLFDITRREIDEYAEYCDCNIRKLEELGIGLNGRLEDLRAAQSGVVQSDVVPSNVIPFPTDRTKRGGVKAA
jgi:hypothetical protein